MSRTAWRHRSARRVDLKSIYGFMFSGVLHLALCILVGLMLMPLGDGRLRVLEMEITLDEPAAELVVVDLEPDLGEFDDQLHWNLPGDAAEAPLHVDDPWSVITSAGGGEGAVGSNATSRGASGGRGQTSFFGTVVQGDQFVYILDLSPSMNARRGKRLERAVLELLRSIDELNDEQAFYVLVFGYRTRRVFDDDSLVPSFVPATLENKRRLRQWLAGLNTISGTDPREALKTALIMHPSAIFLLSDGEFNKPARDTVFTRGLEVDDVMTRWKSAPVFTIAFEDSANELHMQAIANMSGGQHRFVPRPRGESAGTANLSYQVLPRYRKAIEAFEFGDETPAEYYLRLAKFMSDSGASRQANQYYQRVVDQFPDTAAAREAERQLSKSGS